MRRTCLNQDQPGKRLEEILNRLAKECGKSYLDLIWQDYSVSYIGTPETFAPDHSLQALSKGENPLECGPLRSAADPGVSPRFLFVANLASCLAAPSPPLPSSVSGLRPSATTLGKMPKPLCRRLASISSKIRKSDNRSDQWSSGLKLRKKP